MLPGKFGIEPDPEDRRPAKRRMMFKVRETEMPGCLEICAPVISDIRGIFVKTFHHDEFIRHHLVTRFTEEYYTRSHRRVLRGLHFQIPPMDHTKLVYCADGAVMDVVVDLRVGSPSYGKHEIFHLCPGNGNMIYIPPGFAHGFYVTGDSALMVYKVTTVYSPEHDRGILWNSLGIPWPDDTPCLSERDTGFPPIEGFSSPFRFIH